MGEIEKSQGRSVAFIWVTITAFVASIAALLSNLETIQKYIPKQLAIAKWTVEDLEETTWNNNFVQKGQFFQIGGKTIEYTGLPARVVNLDLLAGGECRLSIIPRALNYYYSLHENELPGTIAIVAEEPLNILDKCRWTVNRNDLNIRGTNALAQDIAGAWERQRREELREKNPLVGFIIHTNVEPVERHARIRIRGNTLTGMFEKVELQRAKDGTDRYLPEMKIDLRLVE